MSLTRATFSWRYLRWPPRAMSCQKNHDDVIKCKHFPRYWPFVRGIHRSPVNSPHKGQWRGVLMFSLICLWLNGWKNNREAGDLRRHRAHYDVFIWWRHDMETLNLSLYPLCGDSTGYRWIPNTKGQSNKNWHFFLIVLITFMFYLFSLWTCLSYVNA